MLERLIAFSFLVINDYFIIYLRRLVKQPMTRHWHRWPRILNPLGGFRCERGELCVVISLKSTQCIGRLIPEISFPHLRMESSSFGTRTLLTKWVLNNFLELDKSSFPIIQAYKQEWFCSLIHRCLEGHDWTPVNHDLYFFPAASFFPLLSSLSFVDRYLFKYHLQAISSPAFYFSCIFCSSRFHCENVLVLLCCFFADHCDGIDYDSLLSAVSLLPSFFIVHLFSPPHFFFSFATNFWMFTNEGRSGFLRM